MDNSMEVPQKKKKKTKNRIAVWSNHPIPGHIASQNHSSKRYMYPIVHRSTIHNSQDMETTYMSTDRGMDKEDVVHMCNGILLSCEKRMKAIWSNMDRSWDDHIEWRKSEWKRQIPYDTTYM